MRCNYCGLALAADDVAPFHEICALEASNEPFDFSDSVYDAAHYGTPREEQA